MTEGIEGKPNLTPDIDDAEEALEIAEKQAFKKLLIAIEEKAKEKGIPATTEPQYYPFLHVAENGKQSKCLLRTNPAHLDANGRILVAVVDLMQVLDNTPSVGETVWIQLQTWNLLTDWGGEDEIKVDSISLDNATGAETITELSNLATRHIEAQTAELQAVHQVVGNKGVFIPQTSRGLN